MVNAILLDTVTGENLYILLCGISVNDIFVGSSQAMYFLDILWNFLVPSVYVLGPLSASC